MQANLAIVHVGCVTCMSRAYASRPSIKSLAVFKHFDL